METLTSRAIALPEAKSPFGKEAAAFKARSEPRAGAGVKSVVPDSSEWRFLGMDKRLEALPSLRYLILSGKAELVYCETPSSTCEEKAAAAGIHTDSVVKAISSQDIFGRERYLIIATGKGRLRLTGILSEHLEFASLEVSPEPPPGMAHGTCTPFVPQEVLAGLEFIAIESPDAERKGKKGRKIGKVGDLMADIAIGGDDQMAHHLSVRMPYREFAEALIEAYPGKVKVLSEIERL
jgi:hypothetical protein